MQLGRCAVKAVAAVWLFSQLGTFVGAPLAVWATAEAGTIECHCTHGPDATCPMHQTKGRVPRPCQMQSATDWVTTAAFSSLLGVIGIPTRFSSFGDLVVTGPIASSRVPRAVTDSASPDPPPPRS